jgi:ribosome-associated protein
LFFRGRWQRNAKLSSLRKLITFDLTHTSILSTKTERLAKKKTSKVSLKKVVIDAILDKKGNDVVSLDLRKIKDTPSEFLIITHGDSNTHVKAICDNVIEETREAGFPVYHTEGQKNGEWIIVDYVDVTVHIFYRDKRDFYALEELWNDAKSTSHKE